MRMKEPFLTASPSLLFCPAVFCLLFILPTISARLVGRRLPGPSDDVVEDEGEADEAYSSLSDIYLCMGIAFGWAIFIVRSFSKSNMLQYARGAIHINGHVIQSKVDLEGNGISGIPVYRALIDYVYEFQGNTFQVRKAFETEKLLELGFSNVELLVLPAEPTSGLLINQWETEYALEQKEEVMRRRWMYVKFTLGAVFVLLSIGGAIFAVLRLPEADQTTGWICLTTAIVLLGPLSFFFYRYAKRCYVAANRSAEAGMILRGNVASITHLQPGVACLVDETCDDRNALESPTTPRHSNRRPSSRRSPFSGLGIRPHKLLTEQAEPESRFYFVCMPQQRVDSIRSTSTISSLSIRSLQQSSNEGGGDEIKAGMLT